MKKRGNVHTGPDLRLQKLSSTYQRTADHTELRIRMRCRERKGLHRDGCENKQADQASRLYGISRLACPRSAPVPLHSSQDGDPLMSLQNLPRTPPGTWREERHSFRLGTAPLYVGERHVTVTSVKAWGWWRDLCSMTKSPESYSIIHQNAITAVLQTPTDGKTPNAVRGPVGSMPLTLRLSANFRLAVAYRSIVNRRDVFCHNYEIEIHYLKTFNGKYVFVDEV